jgi:hypothetical protein
VGSAHGILARGAQLNASKLAQPSCDVSAGCCTYACCMRQGGVPAGAGRDHCWVEALSPAWGGRGNRKLPCKSWLATAASAHAHDAHIWRVCACASAHPQASRASRSAAVGRWRIGKPQTAGQLAAMRHAAAG